ncbi:MAG: DMT family transporter [Nitratireductor sp.]|nr:DMT family transporter [Nitratireductor sp.]
MQTAAIQPQSRTVNGILLMTVGVAFLCVNDALAKTLTAHYAPLQILFMRNVISLPFAFYLALRMGGQAALRSHRPATHFARGALWIFATILFFTSIKHLGLAEATALVFIAPVFITALSALLLREHVGWRRWLAVLAGFAGVLVVVRPGAGTFEPISMLPVATAFVYALLMLSARLVDPRESVWTLLLYLTGTSAIMSACIVPFVWIALRPEHLWLFFAIALAGTTGMTMITQAFRFAPASVIAPLDYTALIWATILGWFLWGEIPDVITYAGAAIIIASGIYIILRERKSATG